MNVQEAGELAVIAQLRAIFDAHRADTPVGNGDDAVVWQPDGAVVATVDSVVAGVDWLVGVTPAAAIGHRAAAVNLSDLAAMGAHPRILLLALEVPPDQDLAELLEAARGLHALAILHGANVVGGDLGFSPGPARWTVTALGTLQGAPLRRDRVEPGDAIWLLGDVGKAALGLAVLRAGLAQPDLVRAHVWPQPLVQEALRLRDAGVRAAIDISDGLGLDAQRLAAASGVDLELDLPRPAWLSLDLEAWLQVNGLDWRAACASGGDDYALLCAAPDDVDLRPQGAIRLGQARAGHARVTLRIAGTPVLVQGFRHGR